MLTPTEQRESWYQRGIVPRSSNDSSPKSSFTVSRPKTPVEQTARPNTNISHLDARSRESSVILDMDLTDLTGSNNQPESIDLTDDTVTKRKRKHSPTNIVTAVRMSDVDTGWTSDYGDEAPDNNTSTSKRRHEKHPTKPFLTKPAKAYATKVTKKHKKNKAAKFVSKKKFVNPFEKYAALQDAIESKQNQRENEVPLIDLSMDDGEDDNNKDVLIEEKEQVPTTSTGSSKPVRIASGLSAREDSAIEVFADANSGTNEDPLFIPDSVAPTSAKDRTSTSIKLLPANLDKANKPGDSASSNSTTSNIDVQHLLQTLGPMLQQLSDDQAAVNNELTTQLKLQHEAINALKAENTMLRGQSKRTKKSLRELSLWRNLMDTNEHEKLIKEGKIKPVPGGAYGGPPRDDAQRVRLI